MIQYTVEELVTLHEAAEDGYPVAQYKLGVYYTFDADDSVVDRHEKAIRYFRMAAEKFYAPALYDLGHALSHCTGRDEWKNRVPLHLLAAIEGDRSAQYSMGSYYQLGEFVEQDYEQSIYWYEQAAKMGCSNSLYELGVYYREGIAVPRDIKRAINYLLESARQRHWGAPRVLAEIYRTGDGVRQNLAAAAKWEIHQAIDGDSRSCKKLALAYRNGNGVAQSRAKAYAWAKMEKKLGGKDTKKLRQHLRRTLTIEEKKESMRVFKSLFATYKSDRDPIEVAYITKINKDA